MGDGVEIEANGVRRMNNGVSNAMADNHEDRRCKPSFERRYLGLCATRRPRDTFIVLHATFPID
ncbi:hypothetical protein T4D_14517 [Trichinella pseudospiralis]|uniref:Uncharacterized protein n=1 Tax=Trichinella pseudospiralis TaxID=6337 RepID=A0A0V1FKY7_TRIPS|nr:hypothetical protein T4D_14517 [Trichinella pseudospiralis]